MDIKSFILNGGILGAIRGYDAEKEGRPYGFSELNEDLDQICECCGKARHYISECNYSFDDDED